MSVAESPFQIQFRGSFSSLLSWQQLNDFWQIVAARADQGWYIYALGMDVPQQPRNGADVQRFVLAVDTLLRNDHHEDYCGIVYTDSKTEPTFVKIFDPNFLGASCGSSKNPPLPGWIMSLARPTALSHPRVIPEGRKRWWMNLWQPAPVAAVSTR